MPPARIPRTVARGQRKPNLRRSAEHLAFIRQLPCMICGNKSHVEAAHVRCGTDGGTAIKPSDRYTVPLCTTRGVLVEGCHNMQHRLGEETFWANLRINPLGVAYSLWTHSGDLEAGERIIFRTRQQIYLANSHDE